MVLPSSINSIQSGAFSECTELNDFYCKAKEVPSTASNAFEASLIVKTTLHVPAASVDNYKATVPWSGFKNLLPIYSEMRCVKPTISIANGKVSFSSETEDVEFIYEISQVGSGKEVELSNKYLIKVYAKKENYDDSEIATAEVDIKSGDANGDGLVDAEDIVKVTNIIMGE